MSKKINLQDLVTLLAEKSGITKKEAETFLREYINVIDEGLLSDKIVKIKSLGTFKTTLVNERESINVTNGNRVSIPAHYKISYTPDTQLAQVINEPFALFEGVEVVNDSIMEHTEVIEEIDIPEEQVEEKTIISNEIPVIEKVPVVEEIPVDKINFTEKEIPENTKKRPEIIIEKKPEIKEDIIREFTEISNPSRKEGTEERPLIRAQRKKQIRRFPWEWIVSVILLFGIGWLYYTIELQEKKEIESIRATFIVPAQKRTPNNREVITDSTMVDSIKEQSSIPPMLLRNPEETPKTEVQKETLSTEIEKETAKSTIKTNTPKEQTVQSKTVVEKANTTSENNTNTKVRKITAGERLTLIALEEYGNKSFWIYIYLENKKRILNPNSVPAGTEIIIPAASKYGIDKNSQESINRANELVKQNKSDF